MEDQKKQTKNDNTINKYITNDIKDEREIWIETNTNKPKTSETNTAKRN